MAAFGLMLLIQWMMRDRELAEVVNQTHAIVRAFILLFLLWLILTSTGNSNAFIYFQF
jgi:hypothetical protein